MSNIGKRNKFYVNTKLFDIEIKAKAVAVYTYLSFCCNKFGQAFPSRSRIAKNCGMSVRSVDNAVSELVGSGLITVKNQFMETTKGRNRQSTNLYCILHRGCAVDTEEPMQNVHTAEATFAEEINYNYIYTNNNKYNKSLYHCEPQKDGMSNEITSTMNMSELGRLKDYNFAKTLHTVIFQMYCSPGGITVDNVVIPQELVRQQLRRLNFEVIEFAYKRFKENAIDVKRGKQYMMACLYNAIIDYDIAITAEVAKM